MIPRYELKFIVRAVDRDRVLQALQPGLEPDPYGEDARYRVTSLYFDSPRLTCYWEKMDGVAIRSKVRMRTYGAVRRPEDFDTHTTFLEIKHRVNQTLYKERVRLKPEAVREILRDVRALHDLDGSVQAGDRLHRQTIATIERLAALWDLRSTVVISYRREAYVGILDERLRVTFDAFCCAYEPDRFLDAPGDAGLPLLPDAHMIMELKFDHAIPRWLRDVVGSYGLQLVRFSKYASGVEALDQVDYRRRYALLARARAGAVDADE